MSRRTSRTREVFSSWPVARWKRRLNCSFFSDRSSSCSWSGVIVLRSENLCFVFIGPSSLGDALDEARADRQLRRAEAQRLAGHVLRHAVDLEHDAAWLDARRPVFGRALAGTHAHLGRLGRDRHIREDADPHPPGALHGARDGAAGGLDLARVDALRLEGLESELAEVEIRAALGRPVDAAFELLAELGFLGLQHGSLVPPFSRLRRALTLALAAAARAGAFLVHAFVLRHRIVL